MKVFQQTVNTQSVQSSLWKAADMMFKHERVHNKWLRLYIFHGLRNEQIVYIFLLLRFTVSLIAFTVDEFKKWQGTNHETMVDSTDINHIS